MVSMFAFGEERTAVSYGPKKSKNVLVVSSMHHDDRKQIHNYRPVVLLSSFAKVFEILLHDT
jgi:hypothetical protein